MKKLIYHIVSFLWGPLIVVLPIATFSECTGQIDDLQHFYRNICGGYEVSNSLLSALWPCGFMAGLYMLLKVKPELSRMIIFSLLTFIILILWLFSPDISFFFDDRSGFSSEKKYYAKTLMVMLPYYIAYAFSISLSIFLYALTNYRAQLKRKEGDMEKWERILLNIPL